MFTAAIKKMEYQSTGFILPTQKNNFQTTKLCNNEMTSSIKLTKIQYKTKLTISILTQIQEQMNQIL